MQVDECRLCVVSHVALQVNFQLALLVLIGIHIATMKHSTVFICMFVDRALATIMIVIELIGLLQ